MSVIRRVPGPVGGPARSFTNVANQHLVAEIGTFGLGAADPVWFAVWTRIVAGSGSGFYLGATTSQMDSRGLDIYSGVVGPYIRNVANYHGANTATFTESDGWSLLIFEWASSTSRTAYVYTSAGVSRSATDTASQSVAAAPTKLVLGQFEGEATQRHNGGIARAALGTGATTELLRTHLRTRHPLSHPSSGLLECWDLDSMGVLTGQVRGTPLVAAASTALGGLIPGPTQIEGPPVGRRFFVGTAAGATAYTLTGTAGAVTVTAPTGLLTRALEIAGTAGSVVVSAPTAALNLVRRITGTAGTVAVTAPDATLTKVGNATLEATAGEVAVTGTNATLTRTHRVDATAGDTTVTGTNAALTYLRLLVATVGSMLATGTNAVANLWRRLFGTTTTVEAEAPTASGEFSRVIQAQAGTVEATAPSATLTYSGAPEAAVKKTFMLMGVQK